MDGLTCASRLKQLEGPHTLPAFGVRHCPAPLQMPLPRHAPLPMFPHSDCGSSPSAMGPQTPSLPCPFAAAEHAWHVPEHDVAQQTPSTQLWLVHCPFELHGEGVQLDVVG